MRLRGFRNPLFLLLALALAATLAVAACNDDDDEETEGSPTATAGEKIDISGVAELEDGTLTVCSDIAYAPLEFYPEGSDEPDGFDVDLGNALGDELGVEVEFINTGFDGIIPALQTEDCDAIMSAMTITEEREEQIAFVPYLNVGTGILVPSGNPEGIEDLEDLCGLTVAVQLATIQEKLANEIVCTEGSVTVVTFDTNPLAVEDLRTGGADANLADFPVAWLDAAESDGDLEVLDANFGPFPYGIGLRKESEALNEALDEALSRLRDGGTYSDVLAEWNLEAVARD